MSKLKVGQTLWWEPRRGFGASCEVIVTKVGNKWATLSNKYRIDMTTLAADGHGYTAPGQCYLSKEERMEQTRRDQLWRELQRIARDCNRCPPKALTEDLEEAVRLLSKHNIP